MMGDWTVTNDSQDLIKKEKKVYQQNFRPSGWPNNNNNNNNDSMWLLSKVHLTTHPMRTRS